MEFQKKAAFLVVTLFVGLGLVTVKVLHPLHFVASYSADK